MISIAEVQARRAAAGPEALAIDASLELGIRLSAIQAARRQSSRAASSSRSTAASLASTKGRLREWRGISALDHADAYSSAARPMPTAMAPTPGREASNARIVPLNPESKPE